MPITRGRAAGSGGEQGDGIDECWTRAAPGRKYLAARRKIRLDGVLDDRLIIRSAVTGRLPGRCASTPLDRPLLGEPRGSSDGEPTLDCAGRGVGVTRRLDARLPGNAKPTARRRRREHARLHEGRRLSSNRDPPLSTAPGFGSRSRAPPAVLFIHGGLGDLRPGSRGQRARITFAIASIALLGPIESLGVLVDRRRRRRAGCADIDRAALVGLSPVVIALDVAVARRAWRRMSCGRCERPAGRPVHEGAGRGLRGCHRVRRPRHRNGDRLCGVGAGVDDAMRELWRVTPDLMWNPTARLAALRTRSTGGRVARRRRHRCTRSAREASAGAESHAPCRARNSSRSTPTTTSRCVSLTASAPSMLSPVRVADLPRRRVDGDERGAGLLVHHEAARRCAASRMFHLVVCRPPRNADAVRDAVHRVECVDETDSRPFGERGTPAPSSSRDRRQISHHPAPLRPGQSALVGACAPSGRSPHDVVLEVLHRRAGSGRARPSARSKPNVPSR